MTCPNRLVVVFLVVVSYLLVVSLHQAPHLPILAPLDIPFGDPLERLRRGELGPDHIEIAGPSASILFSSGRAARRSVRICRIAERWVHERCLGMQRLVCGQKRKEIAIHGVEPLEISSRNIGMPLTSELSSIFLAMRGSKNRMSCSRLTPGSPFFRLFSLELAFWAEDPVRT